MSWSTFRWTLCSAALCLIPASATLAGQPDGVTAGFAAERQWSDKSGKHQISGRLQFADDSKVQLLTADGKTVQIGNPQLSEADRAFIQAFLIAENAASPAGEASPFQVVETESPLPTTSAAPLAASMARSSAAPMPRSRGTPVAIEEVPEVKISRGSVKLAGWKIAKEFWDAQPPAASVVKADGDVTITSKLKSFRDRSVAVGGGSPRAFVTTYEEWGGKGETTLAVFDYAAADTVAEAAYPLPLKAMAMSPNGRLAAAVWVEGFGKGSTLYLFDIRGDSFQPIYKLVAGGGKWDELVSVHFLSNNRLLTLTEKKQVSLWDLSGQEVVHSSLGQMAGQSLELSPAADQLAMIDGQAVGVIDMKTMKQIGCIIPPAQPLNVAFASDGKSIAVQSDAELHLYSTATGKLVKTLPTAEQTAQKVKNFGDYVLLGDRMYEVENGVPVWKFSWGADAPATGNLLVGQPGHSQGFGVTFVAVPNDVVEDKLSGVDGSELYALKPGMSVAIDVKAPDNQYMTSDAIREGLTKTVEKNGWKMDPSAKIRFTATLERLPDEDFEYEITEGHPFFPSPFHRGRSTGKTGTVRFTPWRATVKLVEGDKILWEQSRHHGAPQGASLQAEETVQQAVVRIVRPSLEFFEGSVPPPHVIPPNLLNGFGQTSLK